VDRCMGQWSLAFVASDHHITYWPKASSHRYQIEPALPPRVPPGNLIPQSLL
jgi:hypothetical protein